MKMAKEPKVSLPAEEPRRCPACGTRVAAQATTCLMCGASLVEEEIAPEEKGAKKLPGWVRAMIVVLLASAILAAGGFGLHKLMTAEPKDSTPTATPTRTPTVTPTPTPTQTPTPRPTPTPVPPLVHQVQEGDTLSGIATAYATSIEALMAMNPGIEPENLQPGQILLIPAGTLTPTPTPTLDPSVPTPTPGDFIIHIVAPGETLSSIAEQYEVSVPLLREVNELPIGEDIIFVNQSLVIPLGTPVPSPTPTVDPHATPTPVPPYAPPQLLVPPDGAVFSGADETIVLQWATVSVLRSNEWYALTIFQPAGDVVSDTTYTRATAWRVPLDLLTTTGAETREFHWRVEVVRETRDRNGELVYQAGGPPSEVRTFIWVEVAPTPTSSPTPTP